MSVPAGKIYRRDQYDASVTWRGPYSAITTYVPGDLVTSGGAPYLYIWSRINPTDSFPATAPTPPNATYWLAL